MMADASAGPSVSIVVIGKFNPSIFSPAWLEKTGLISGDESDAAEIQLIHRDVASFTAGAFTFDVRRTRCSIEMTQEPYVAALDATMLIFGEQLHHTDISEFGINFNTHFSVGDKGKRLALGRKLAPVEPWGDFGRDIVAMDDRQVSGVIELVMVKNYEPKGSGELRVQIEPSSSLDPDGGGVFMTVNDHRIILDHKEGDGPVAALDLLSSCFDNALDEGVKIVEHIKVLARGL